MKICNKRNKICIVCKKKFYDDSKSNTRKCCNENCSKERIKIAQQKFNAKNPLKSKKYHQKKNKEWMMKNPKYQKDYRKANWDKIRKTEKKYERKTLLEKYGLNEDKYMKLLKIQNNKCAICSKDAYELKGHHKHLAVDHNHITGKVRGLLCNDCNMGLGKFKDNKKLIKRALLYLRGE